MEQKTLQKKNQKNQHLQFEVNKQLKCKIETLKELWTQFTTIDKWKLAKNYEIKTTGMQKVKKKYERFIKRF